MSEEPVYVRYVYLTPKGKELLESIEKALQSEIAIERIPKEYGPPPLPPRKMRTSDETGEEND